MKIDAVTGNVTPGGDVPAHPPGTAGEVMLAATGKASRENFPVALRVLPARYRRRLTALYGYARLADDMGDEARSDTRSGLLDELEADVARLYRPGAGGPRLPAVRALAPVVAECGVPPEPLLDLIEANRQDQVVTRYKDFGELAAYCRLSANPVGRIVLHIFGVASARRVRLSDSICTALQLVEHWQDVAEDLGKGRIYLPLADMEEFGCDEADLAAPVTPPRLRALIAYEARRASSLLDEGAPLIGTLRGSARLAVSGYVAGGRAALDAIGASRGDVLGSTPRPDKRRLAAHLVSAYTEGR